MDVVIWVIWAVFGMLTVVMTVSFVSDIFSGRKRRAVSPTELEDELTPEQKRNVDKAMREWDDGKVKRDAEKAEADAWVARETATNGLAVVKFIIAGETEVRSGVTCHPYVNPFIGSFPVPYTAEANARDNLECYFKRGYYEMPDGKCIPMGQIKAMWVEKAL